MASAGDDENQRLSARSLAEQNACVGFISDCANGTAALQQRANARAADIAPTIKSLQAAGATSLRAIAAALNDQGIPTARGGGQWTATQVARVLDRM
jgi:hypothetical protein